MERRTYEWSWNRSYEVGSDSQGSIGSQKMLENIRDKVKFLERAMAYGDVEIEIKICAKGMQQSAAHPVSDEDGGVEDNASTRVQTQSTAGENGLASWKETQKKNSSDTVRATMPVQDMLRKLRLERMLANSKDATPAKKQPELRFCVGDSYNKRSHDDAFGGEEIEWYRSRYNSCAEEEDVCGLEW